MTAISKLRKEIPEGADCVLVTSELNQRYLTGLHTEGYVVVGRDHAWLLTDFRYIEIAEKRASDELSVVLLESRKKTLPTLFAENGFVNVGFEDDIVTCAELDRFRALFPEINFVKAGGIIEKIRRYKTPDEAENIVKAQRIAEKALDRLFSLMTPDMTEREVAIELDFGMRRLGAEGNAFETIAVSGTASSMPHGVPRDVKLEKGFLTMDFGALYNGYCSDMTRTVVLGRADDEMKKVYNTVLRAQTEAEKHIKEGVTGAECDKVARDIIDGAGYEGRFGHSLGHGVGMYIHELPSLSSSWDKPLEVGNVVTDEPGIYIPGHYGVRIEDMIYISENGPVNLTKAEKDLIELF
ncbi:MAG: aminopeptidase P family protein [Clostridia bacterium]|nr:aminopeptidase P family protein [Clostridia bacterium]